MSKLTEIRQKAGWSRDRAAVEARVAYATCRIYEVSPDAVADRNARARLDGVWQTMRSESAPRMVKSVG